MYTGRRGPGGGGGSAFLPSFNLFFYFFGQNADDSSKSIRDKTISKAVLNRLVGYCL